MKPRLDPRSRFQDNHMIHALPRYAVRSAEALPTAQRSLFPSPTSSRRCRALGASVSVLGALINTEALPEVGEGLPRLKAQLPIKGAVVPRRRAPAILPTAHLHTEKRSCAAVASYPKPNLPWPSILCVSVLARRDARSKRLTGPQPRLRSGTFSISVVLQCSRTSQL